MISTAPSPHVGHDPSRFKSPCASAIFLSLPFLGDYLDIREPFQERIHLQTNFGEVRAMATEHQSDQPAPKPPPSLFPACLELLGYFDQFSWLSILQ